MNRNPSSWWRASSVVEQDPGGLAMPLAGVRDRPQRGDVGLVVKCPGTPSACERSAGPTNSTSTSSIDAISSAAASAPRFDLDDPDQRSLTTRATSAWASAPSRAPRVRSARPREPTGG